MWKAHKRALRALTPEGTEVYGTWVKSSFKRAQNKTENQKARKVLNKSMTGHDDAP